MSSLPAVLVSELCPAVNPLAPTAGAAALDESQQSEFSSSVEDGGRDGCPCEANLPFNL